mmetsp:Transcript_36209/g.88063  ORF Transcript_36209/g.88063 Transcript_36209/m.88063 type:complete len:336 (-) Transcript_36209:283-1290(-)
MLRTCALLSMTAVCGAFMTPSFMPRSSMPLSASSVVSGAPLGGAAVAGSRRNRPSIVNLNAMASKTKDPKFALLFDCDGVIVLTEELHRLAYNGAFKEFELTTDGKAVDWDVAYYDILQNTVGGGKPKMKWHFNNKSGWPASKMGGVPTSDEDKDALVDSLQDTKTEIYKKLVTEVATARPGVLEMLDAVLDRPDIAAGICSAATRGGFDQVVNSVVGKDRLDSLDVVMAGDDVPRKKPDPIIYQLAGEKVGLAPEKCVVVEDSLVGLRAAKGAGMRCIITYTESTKDCDFYAEGADAVVEDFSKITLDDVFKPLFEGETDILKAFKDAPKAAAK